MGDAGSVKRSEDFFDGETFLVVGGDDISDIDSVRPDADAPGQNAASTIATTEVDDPSQFGIVVTNDDGRITRFLEKPKGSDVFSKMANTGVYVFEPGVFNLIPPDTFYGFGNNVFPQPSRRRQAAVRLCDAVLLERCRQPASLPADEL